MLFNLPEPDQQILPQAVVIVAPLLYIEYRRKVTRFQPDRTDKEICLPCSIRLRIVKMICPTDKSILTCQIEIMHKRRITEISTLRSLQKNKADRERSKLRFAERCPVYFPLMMRNIEPMHPIP